MNLPNRNYKTAIRLAYEAGCEKIANPGHEDCNVRNAQEGFCYYANVDKFDDLTKDQKKDFFREWQRGMKDEREACGLVLLSPLLHEHHSTRRAR